MREAFRLIYHQAIRVQSERERAIFDEHDEPKAERLMRERDGLIEAMVVLANSASDPADRAYLATYNSVEKAWDMVFANAGDIKWAKVNT